MLAKLALVPQKVMNSYMKPNQKPSPNGIYTPGDFVANFHGCDKPKRDCEAEQEPLLRKLKEESRM